MRWPRLQFVSLVLLGRILVLPLGAMAAMAPVHCHFVVAMEPSVTIRLERQSQYDERREPRPSTKQN